MGLFGNDDEQDKRLDELERRVRRVVEQVGQLSVDLGQTRTELLRTRAAVSDAVSSGDVDPLFDKLNTSIAEARAKLAETQSAADESWALLAEGSESALDAMRTGIDGAWKRLEQSAGD